MALGTPYSLLSWRPEVADRNSKPLRARMSGDYCGVSLDEALF